MAEQTTLRLVLAISSALKQNIDHLDIKTTFLNGEIPQNEQFFCSPPPGFRVLDGMGWLIKKGLYGAHQSGSIWRRPSALGCTRTTLNMFKLETNDAST